MTVTCRVVQYNSYMRFNVRLLTPKTIIWVAQSNALLEEPPQCSLILVDTFLAFLPLYRSRVVAQSEAPDYLSATSLSFNRLHFIRSNKVFLIDQTNTKFLSVCFVFTGRVCFLFSQVYHSTRDETTIEGKCTS